MSDPLRRAGFRRAALLLATLLCVALAAPASRAACSEEPGGIGGTGFAPGAKPGDARGKGKDRGGIGGTGRSEKDAGGIGDTGRREKDDGGIGGTGIVGVITGFGSVCVNGLEVEYDAATPVDVNGASGQASALAIGQVVVIEARQRDGALVADRIGVRSAAIGPVERVDAQRGRVEVLGQQVRIDPATRVVDAAGRPTALDALAPGSFVAVSGLRAPDGSVAATRIEAVAPRDVVSLTGPLDATASGALAVGSLAVTPPPGGTPAALADRVALVVGRIDPGSGALRAERIEPAVRFATPPTRLVVEGFVHEATAKGFRTEHAAVDVSALGTAAAVAAPGARVVVSGALEADGRVRAERIEVVAPERPGRHDREHDDRGRSPGAGVHRDDDAAEVEHEGAGAHEQVEHGEHAEQAEHGEHVETPEHGEQPEVHEAPETPEAPEVEHPDAPEQVEKPEAPEKPEQPEVPETPEHVERPETPEVERPETPEVPEVERPETPEPIEIERPETPERIEIERPEAPERPEIEEPEMPERPEAPEHDD